MENKYKLRQQFESEVKANSTDNITTLFELSPIRYAEWLENKICDSDKTMNSIQDIIKKHKGKLSIMLDNRIKAEEYKWSDADINECSKMIEVLASVLSDLNKVVNNQ